MGEISLQLLLILSLTLANGLFAASEIAIVSSRRNRLQQSALLGNRGAQVALDLAEEPNRFLSTVQVGISLIATFAGAYGGDVLADPLADALAPYAGRSASSLALAIVVLMITYLSLILGELVPKRLALQHAEGIAVAVAPFMQFLSKVAAPVVWFLSFSTQVVLRLLGRSEVKEEEITEDDILSMVREGTESGTVEATQLELIERVFDMSDASVRSIMTPRTEIFAMSQDTPLEQIIELVASSGYSRIPVYDGSLDNVLGILYAKDLLSMLHSPARLETAPVSFQESLRQPVFVVEHQRVGDLLQKFKQTHNHIALVLDEYGQIDGLVTLEDVLEIIMGEIADEHDEDEEERVIERADGSFLVDGLLSYGDAEDRLGFPPRETITDLPSFDTVAGLLLAVLNHLPAVGEQAEWQDWILEVVDLDGRRIDKVLVRSRAIEDQERNEAALAIGAVLPPPDASMDQDDGAPSADQDETETLDDNEVSSTDDLQLP